MSAGTNYYVSLAGCDTNSEFGRDTAFRTIQRGVDALAAGDTLTIAPGNILEPSAGQIWVGQTLQR